MSEDKLIEKARTFAKNGELQRAKDILEALDSERAKSLLNKVNLALLAKKREMVGQHSQAAQTPKIAPKEAKAAKPKQKANPLLSLVALAVICGACWFSMQGAIESGKNSASGQEIEIEVMLRANTDIDLANVRVLHREDGYSGIIIGYNTRMGNETDMYAEYGAIFGTLGTMVQQEAWDFDDLSLVVGDRNGDVLHIVTVQMADVVAYVNDDISVETFMERMSFADF